MRRALSRTAVVCGVIGFLSTSRFAEPFAQGADPFQDAIAAIAAGEDSAARGKAIVDFLKAEGIDVHLEDFSFPQYAGTNIVATLPARNATRTLLLGAHYDRTPRGRGAIDNAASCAVLERLLVDLKANALQHYAVTVVFFDLEERGLVGSQAYFARHQERPDKAINLDIFGYGDTFFVTASPFDGPLLTSLQEAAKDSPIHVRAIASVQEYPTSDHRIMMNAKIDTLGLALIDGAEVDAVLEHGASPPRIATIIHTDADTLDTIRPQDMERAFPVLEKAIRLMDSRTAGEAVH
jgi:aminopeptidase S